MRELTVDEIAVRDRCVTDFDDFYIEILDVLVDFASRLQLPDPPLILTEVERYLEPIDQFISHQEVLPDDRDWIQVRLAYFIGEFLVQRFGGCWYVNDIPTHASSCGMSLEDLHGSKTQTPWCVRFKLRICICVRNTITR